MSSAPQILARVGEELDKMDSSLEDIAGIIRLDAAITTRIIRVANSAAYNTSRQPFGSVEEALARLGLLQTYRIVGIAAVQQFSDQHLPTYGITGGRLRENSLLTALFMEAMTVRSDFCNNAAYTAALLRSTGKIAIDRLNREKVTDASWINAPLADAENSFAGINNCEATSVILSEWRFPKKTVGAIRAHYTPDQNDPLAILLNLACGAAEREGYGIPGESTYWEISPEKLEAIRIDATDIDSAIGAGLKRFAILRDLVA